MNSNEQMEQADDSRPSYHALDEQPKDLTLKTARKMKLIPPPLNLSANESSARLPSSLLKEFANFATSPKSPLMQKHLPFRKRTHLLSNCPKPNYEDNYPENYISTTNVNEMSAFDAEQLLPDQQHLNGVSSSVVEENGCHNLNVPSSVAEENRCHFEVPVSSSLACDDQSNNCVLDLSTNSSSVLLSPAPSSISSSREELADSTRASPFFHTRLWGLPWPPPIWHCFQPGSKVKLGSVWCNVEEMGACPVDWPQELKVEQIAIGDTSVVLSLCAVTADRGLTTDRMLTAEVSSVHAFLVKDRGWSAVCGESLFAAYSVRCPSLQLNDTIMVPTIHKLALPLPLPSPDICERIKRFSFPPPDDAQSPAPLVLSPPATPTRKTTQAQDHAEKPKRPMNAFMLFAKRFRLELIQSHPGKDNRAISVILGEVWRTLPQEEREIYIRGARDLSEEQKLLHPDCWKRKRSHSAS
ncbi:HMG box-containing protein 1 isoform X2 [Nilaparvata lugens]|uniref:HMG box-containing protein 1 isoform X2 n=1 Tax=Nilaparvata lugens TaxID=108931 RepID=UPI00193C88A3|nr:HMG box-containing protein 1 isoform X2 [Nilaparvata lugens]